ncbi:C2H2-type domain-containing protein [Aphis craccivora]|uniref:C2H2-type domain-containing protein n=1 Tax=Aphis craccivora TaxID=307492 RepID=A0A6G0Y5C2_APHCR|nr:C2H2-type domain-containing protein [Aphis craccivora]
MNNGHNLFETFLSDGMDIYETDTQYTKLQNSNSLDIQYDIHIPLNNLVDDTNQEESECVDVEALRYITKDEIIQLLNKHPLGTRVKCAQYVKEWQKSIRGNTLQDISASIKLSETSGAIIVNYYSMNNNLNESCRNLIVDLIIATLVDKKISMTVALVNTIATVIVETFTSEIKMQGLNVQKESCILNRYFNKIRNLKHHGLVPQQPKEKKCVEQETRISMELDCEISTKNDIDMLLSGDDEYYKTLAARKIIYESIGAYNRGHEKWRVIDAIQVVKSSNGFLKGQNQLPLDPEIEPPQEPLSTYIPELRGRSTAFIDGLGFVYYHHSTKRNNRLL